MVSFESVTVLKGKDLKWRLIRSLALLSSYVVHGMYLGTIGPTMLDIQIRTNATIAEVTYVIMGRAIGMSIATFLAGPLTRYLDIQLCISLAMIVAAIATAGVPWPKNIITTVVVFFVSGLGFGVEETCLYLYMVFLWGSECEPFIQALHFCFGLGASIAPLIAREFILPRNESNIDEWQPDDVQIHYCYEICAIGSFMISMTFLCLNRLAPQSEEHPSRLEEAEKNGNDQFNVSSFQPTISMIEKDKHQKMKIFLVKSLSVFATSAFVFFYCGIEVNFGTYISPYVIEGPLKMTKSNGAIVASVYWFVFTFSRIITIFYIKIIGSRNNLILCTFILLISNIVLIPFYDNETCLWVGTVLVGLGASSVFASVFGYIELSIKITPLITSFNMAASCLGMSVFPILTSQLFDADPKVFLWLCLLGTVAMAVILALIILSFNYYGRLVLETTENITLRVKPSFGRLNSIMSVASTEGAKRKATK